MIKAKIRPGHFFADIKPDHNREITRYAIRGDTKLFG